MAVAPCSMKTLSGIATGFSEDLIMRAADICLKERRPLILAVRETPLSRIDLEIMLLEADAGAVCMPPVPAFYTNPASIDEIVTQSVCRIMEQLGVKPLDDFKRWGGEGGHVERG
jgi:polyprenyl P-hydroxybenzoate/phenylacrylic acid decarboxylase-like protein